MPADTVESETKAYDPAVRADHITLWVGNAKQAASYYCLRYGFKPLAYRGLETGEREVCSHAVTQNDITFVFQTALSPDDEVMGLHQQRHGDTVRDIAFTVQNARAAWRYAVARGTRSICEPWEEADEHGTVVQATVVAFGDAVHTFVERAAYSGPFLPGYVVPRHTDTLAETLPPVGLAMVDHMVASQRSGEQAAVSAVYEEQLGFHRFWELHDKHTGSEQTQVDVAFYNAPDDRLTITVTQPAATGGRSQGQEFVDYHGGPGIQHIALHTPDIITAVERMRERGVEFLAIPDTYYTTLRERLKGASITVKESMDVLQRLRILLDYDENGYILQIFATPMQDRPTLFLEIIQRNNNRGFGAGNFKALYEAAEREQQLRGNL